VGGKGEGYQRNALPEFKLTKTFMCRMQVLNYCPAVPSCSFSQEDIATLYEATINASWHCNNVVLQTRSKPFFLLCKTHSISKVCKIMYIVVAVNCGYSVNGVIDNLIL